MISLLGLQFAASPLLAQKRGNGENIENYFWTVIAYSMAISVLSCVLTLLSVHLIPLFKYDPTITKLISEYLIITSFSTAGLCLYQGVKEFFQSQEKTITANLVASLLWV